jgi:hypothetical protein
MARIRLIGLAVLAVFCMSAVGAAAASASEGELVNKEGNALVKNKFTVTSGQGTLETAAGTKIICKKDTGHGIVTSKTGGELTVLFSGCTSGGLSCKGGKDEEGEAPAGSIYVLLGILVKPSKNGERLILLTIHKPGTLEAGELEIVCTGVKIKVKGSLLTFNNFPVGKLSKDYNFVFKQKKGIQEPDEYENEAKEKIKNHLEATVEGLAFEKAGEEGTDLVLFEEEVQFK